MKEQQIRPKRMYLGYLSLSGRSVNPGPTWKMLTLSALRHIDDGVSTIKLCGYLVDGVPNLEASRIYANVYAALRELEISKLVSRDRHLHYRITAFGLRVLLNQEDRPIREMTKSSDMAAFI